MWLNVCDLDKLNNSTLTDKDKELELKGASRSPIENDRMISTLSELIIFKMARWRFRVICHWLWAGDFSFLLPSWCRDWETPPLVIYEIQLLPVTAPSTGPQFSAVQCRASLNWHLDIIRDASGRYWANLVGVTTVCCQQSTFSSSCALSLTCGFIWILKEIPWQETLVQLVYCK